jgi:dihydroorotate dehydrogenase electron transfer subunit
MLRAGHEIAVSRGVPAWVSLEQTMGCAVGACMGCAVQTVPQPQTAGPQYARVCTEGPVFRSTEVAW